MSAIRAPTSARRADAEHVIMELAGRQHGVVARVQLLQAGVAPDVVDRRLKAGRLQRIQRGVYRVGPLVAANAREMAAVLSCGASAWVSHRSAAALWKILPRYGDKAPVDVIVTRGRPGQGKDIRVHLALKLQPDELTKCDGIPITTVARTLYDLAGHGAPEELERALAEGLAQRLTTRQQILSLLARHGGGRGVKRLRVLLECDSGPAFTRSEAERRFLSLVRKAQLRKPEVNVTVEGDERDFYWRAERLVVEVDGRAFHSSDESFESDRRRDARLVAAGLRVMRVTWAQIQREPEALLVRLTQALGWSARP